MRHHRTAHVDSAQEALLTLGRLVDQALERIRGAAAPSAPAPTASTAPSRPVTPFLASAHK